MDGLSPLQLQRLGVVCVAGGIVPPQPRRWLLQRPVASPICACLRAAYPIKPFWSCGGPAAWTAELGADRAACDRLSRRQCLPLVPALTSPPRDAATLTSSLALLCVYCEIYAAGGMHGCEPREPGFCCAVQDGAGPIGPQGRFPRLVIIKLTPADTLVLIDPLITAQTRRL